MIKLFKFLIETNLLIAFAAICFMWANMYFLDIYVESLGYLSAQIFFSTWFVYQISRWIYFKKGQYTNEKELVVQWFIKYPTLNKITIFGSGILAVFFTFFLQPQTIIVLSIIGFISILYPIPVLKPFGIHTRFRDFPFIKIFMIALVWSATSVILPYTESFIYDNHPDVERLVLLLFIVQFIFILFITLPFDINDVETDKVSNIKTIPSVFGVKTSKIITLILGIIYAFAILFMFMLVNWNHMPNKYLSDYTMISIWILIALLQIYTFLKSDKVSKWWIKIVYDGSLIIYFLLIFLTKTT